MSDFNTWSPPLSAMRLFGIVEVIVSFAAFTLLLTSSSAYTLWAGVMMLLVSGLNFALWPDQTPFHPFGVRIFGMLLTGAAIALSIYSILFA